MLVCPPTRGGFDDEGHKPPRRRAIVEHRVRQRMHGMGVLASKAKAATARELVARNGSDREKSHVEVLALGMRGQPAKSLERALAHLDSWPRDAVIMSLPLGAFGLFAFSGMAWGCGMRACDLGPRAAKGVDGAADHRRKRRHVPALALSRLWSPGRCRRPRRARVSDRRRCLRRCARRPCRPAILQPDYPVYPAAGRP